MNRILAVLVVVVLMAAGPCVSDPLIKLQRASFDPLLAVPDAGLGQVESEREANGKGYYILQFTGPVEEEWKTGAAAAGAELLDYVPDFAFIARLDTPSEAKLRALPYVRWLGDYSPSYRVSRRLGSTDSDVVISLFEGSDRTALLNRILSHGGSHDADSAPHLIRARVPAKALLQIAKAAGVAWIEPRPEYKLSNKVARGIITADKAWADLGLYGAGQTVAVADTGLDTGNTLTLSLDFRGRLTNAYALGRTGDWSDSTQYGGHGTHVAGSILGNGTLSGSNAATHSYTASFAGVAPEASLFFQSVMNSFGQLSGIPFDLNSLFQTPYNNGARVHSNSWGDNANLGDYTTDSNNTDEFVWNNKAMVICFAAGNSGEDLSPADGFVDSVSVESPSTAKNCISVGASESVILSGGFQGTYGSQNWGLETNPIAADKASNNANGMAGFSGRGPTNPSTDGRIKPDICAPGTNIISCRTHVSGTGTLWGVYSSDYLYSGGTSMSTPIVAGACALVREYYMKRTSITSPSAALVKATLLNGAFDMTPGQYPVPPGPMEVPTRPNYVEGWGRLDLKNSLVPPASRYMFPTDNSTGLKTNESASYTYYVASSNEPLKVTLVWSDHYSVALSASKFLINDLDLTVTAPGGILHRGNEALGTGQPDRKNNVEGIDLPSAVPGLYTVTVRAYNVPKPTKSSRQPYALIVAGPVTTTQATAISMVAAAKGLADGALITLSGKIVTAGSDDLAGMFYMEEPDRTSGIRVQYGPNGGPVLSEGTAVTVTGKLSTIDGERVVTEPILSF